MDRQRYLTFDGTDGVLHIKLEKNHISVLNDVLPAFDAVLTGFFDFRFSSVFNDVVVSVDFSLDEALLEVGVDGASGFGRRVA